jgi:citrate synthase
MSEVKKTEYIHTRIWQEEPEPDNPFAAQAAYCHGYDVYGDMLGNARWVDMLFLLFRGEAPSSAQAEVLETLAVAVANPGPRDASVHAAMCGGVCGSPAASSLMAALAVGAGQFSGAREVYQAMSIWQACSTDLEKWRSELNAVPVDEGSIWTKMEHAPGFDPHGVSTPTPVRQTLACLAQRSESTALPWLNANREKLEQIAGYPLAMSGIVAAALHELGFSPEQGEMLHLLLRLPGAAAHALEQQRHGYKNFPFYPIELDQARGGQQS